MEHVLKIRSGDTDTNSKTHTYKRTVRILKMDSPETEAPPTERTLQLIGILKADSPAGTERIYTH